MCQGHFVGNLSTQTKFLPNQWVMPTKSAIREQGYAKLVGFEFSIGIEFEFSISNMGFDIDSGFGEVFVLVSVLTQNRNQVLILISSWFRFRSWFSWIPWQESNRAP